MNQTVSTCELTPHSSTRSTYHFLKLHNLFIKVLLVPLLTYISELPFRIENYKID
jgi:hypothetical protein